MFICQRVRWPTHRMVCVQLRPVHQHSVRTPIQLRDLHWEPGDIVSIWGTNKQANISGGQRSNLAFYYHGSTGERTCLSGPHVCGRVEGDDVDVILEVLQQLVELLLAAVAVGEDLHLVGDAPRRPRLNVPQVHVLLLARDRTKSAWNVISEKLEAGRKQEARGLTWKSLRDLTRQPTSFFRENTTAVFPQSSAHSLSGVSLMGQKDGRLDWKMTRNTVTINKNINKDNEFGVLKLKNHRFDPQ